MKAAVFALFLSLAVAQNGLNVMVLGDWGGESHKPYTTPGEVAVARGMNHVAGKIGANFTLALGDNMYTTGVTDVNDPRFQQTFEDVFTGKHLQGPWHVLLGNHDHRGNASAQVAYTQRSKRWSCPDLFYSFQETFSEGGVPYTVDFVMIDTVILCGNTDDAADGAPPGPANLQLADSHYAWIEKTLEASTADFLVVAGHYPVYSVAEHGPTPDLVDHLKPLLEKHTVNAYLCGHDHALEYIDDGKGVQYHVIGAGHDVNPSTKNKDSVPSGSLQFNWASGLSGFGSMAFTSTGMQITHYDSDGKVLYVAPMSPPRR